MSTQAKVFLTADQYLEAERLAECKSEYWRGEVFAMSGASREHNIVSGNVYASLHGQFRGKPCEVYHSNMRVFIPATGLYTYPDVVVVCGEPSFVADDYLDNLLNPRFLVEVLSPSTEGYDRGRKFEHYRTVDSLQEYLLAAQDRMHVDLYTRQPNGTWLLREACRPEDTIELQSIGCRLLLADIYEKATLPAAG